MEKRNFTELLAKVWQRSFTAEHIKAGFRGAGLCPLNPSAIHDEKLAPSLPLQFLSPEVQPPQNTIPAGATSRNEDEATVPFTPLKTHLKDHFTAVLQCTRPAHMRQKGQVKPNEYVEVLTADEVFERIQQQEEERKKKKEKRKKKTRVQSQDTVRQRS